MSAWFDAVQDHFVSLDAFAMELAMKSLGLKLMWVSLGPMLGVVGLAVLVMLTVWQRKLSAAIEQRRDRRALSHAI